MTRHWVNDGSFMGKGYRRSDLSFYVEFFRIFRPVWLVCEPNGSGRTDGARAGYPSSSRPSALLKRN